MCALESVHIVNMIAVSSFKPFSQQDDIATNQIDANRSWHVCFAQIVYFNEFEQQIASPKTFFVGGNDPPSIKELAQYCAIIPGWSCIINADIVLSDTFVLVEPYLNARNARLVTSRRINFHPHAGQRSGKITDLGLDIFISRAGIWKQIADAIPDAFVLGQGMWDTWMAGFGNSTGGYYDITQLRCVYHPIHSRNNEMLDMKKRVGVDRFLAKAALPRMQLVM